MKPPPEQSTTVRRIERRYRIFDCLSGTIMTILGAGILISLFSDFNWVVHHGITHSGKSSRAAYGIALGFAALLYGIIKLARLIKSSRWKSSRKQNN